MEHASMAADFQEFGVVIFANPGFGAHLTQKLIVGNLSSSFCALSDSDGKQCIGNAIYLGEVRQPPVTTGFIGISQDW